MIGPDKEEFTSHKDLLCAASTGFDTLIGTNYKQTGNELEYALALPGEDPSIVEAFLHWLYLREYRRGDVSAEGFLQDACVTEALKLYCFAVRYQVPDLKMKILQELWSMMGQKRIQLKYSQLETVWYDANTDSRLITLVTLYMVWIPRVAAYDGPDLLKWLRPRGDIAVDMLHHMDAKYNWPNIQNPFDGTFPRKTFEEATAEEETQSGGEPVNPQQNETHQDEAQASTETQQNTTDQVNAGGNGDGSSSNDVGRNSQNISQQQFNGGDQEARGGNGQEGGDQGSNEPKGEEKGTNTRKHEAGGGGAEAGNKRRRDDADDSGANGNRGSSLKPQATIRPALGRRRR